MCGWSVALHTGTHTDLPPSPQTIQQEKLVYHHVTCATDTKNVEVVMNACKDIILRGNLKDSGFM